jgi:hypothetical protein
MVLIAKSSRSQWFYNGGFATNLVLGIVGGFDKLRG